jgi:hypothetical protein
LTVYFGAYDCGLHLCHFFVSILDYCQTTIKWKEPKQAKTIVDSIENYEIYMLFVFGCQDLGNNVRN